MRAPENDTAIGRRGVLLGMGAAGALAVAGCGGSSKDAGGGSSGTSKTPAGQPTSGGAPAALAAVSSIPEGGATSVTAGGRKLILSRPAGSTVVAFSAICTHMGCTVAPKGKELDCPCHGSRYDAATGKVLGGPAPAPLPPVQIKVTGGQVFLA